MKTIPQIAAAIKYFEAAIDGLRESMNREVEKDKDILNFKDKVREMGDSLQFVFYPHTLSFALSRGKFLENDRFELLSYFEIIGGKVVFSENTFEGIKEIAAEAQKITQKYFKEED